MGGGCYRSAVFLSGILLLLTGCAANRLVLHVKEPENRWSLSTLPETPAPLDLQMTRVFDGTIPVWSSGMKPFFVTTTDAPGSAAFSTLVEAFNLRLIFSSPLDLLYPDLRPIARTYRGLCSVTRRTGCEGAAGAGNRTARKEQSIRESYQNIGSRPIPQGPRKSSERPISPRCTRLFTRV